MGRVDCAALLAALTGRFGGKGGGKPETAQGGGLTAPTADVVAAASAALSEQLSRTPDA